MWTTDYAMRGRQLTERILHVWNNGDDFVAYGRELRFDTEADVEALKPFASSDAIGRWDDDHAALAAWRARRPSRRRKAAGGGAFRAGPLPPRGKSGGNEGLCFVNTACARAVPRQPLCEPVAAKVLRGLDASP